MAASSDSAAEANSNVSRTGEQASGHREGVTVGPLPEDFLRIEPPQQQDMTQSLPVAGQNVSPQRQHYVAAHPAYAQQIAYSPPNIVGRLILSIVQAKLIKNYSMMFKMDPYVRARVGHQVFETPTAHAGGKNPVWNKTIQCYLPIGCDKVDIDIFDEKSFGEDERVAWAQIDIPPAVYEGNTVDDWFPLSGRTGENGSEGSIQLTFTLHTNIQMPQPRMVAPPGFAYMPYYPTGVVPTAVVQGGTAPNAVQGRMYSDDDLKQVKEMFPDYSDDVILSVLEAQGGNVQAAINALLEMNA